MSVTIKAFSQLCKAQNGNQEGPLLYRAAHFWVLVERRWSQDCLDWVRWAPWRKYKDAEDADDGINGEIYYSLIDPKSSFAVDPVTGVIFLTRPLSHHKQPQHEIAIMAQDRGAKSRFATRAPDTAKVQLSVRQVRKKNI